MIVWRVSHDLPWPEAVECDVPGWPNKDATGATMYDNTHFLEEKDCWEKMLVNAEAGQALGVVDLQQARAGVERATKRLADDAVRFTNTRRAHEEWKRGELKRDPTMMTTTRPTGTALCDNAVTTYEPAVGGFPAASPPCQHCGSPYVLHLPPYHRCPSVVS